MKTLKTPSPTQLGMVGLGRMGANMVRRPIKARHRCIVFDRISKAVRDLANKGAVGTPSFANLVEKLEKPRAVWLMRYQFGGHAAKPTEDSRAA